MSGHAFDAEYLISAVNTSVYGILSIDEQGTILAANRSTCQTFTEGTYLHPFRSPTLHGTPVIIITADAFRNTSELLLAAGAFRFISKPSQLRELQEAVSAALQGRGKNAA